MVLVLVLDFDSADRVRVRVPSKAEYEYEKPGFLARNRIERTGDQREVSEKLKLVSNEEGVALAFNDQGGRLALISQKT